MTKVRHVLGISGGKDSAALAIYMKQRYPNLDLEYYTCDTGKELDETYELIDKLENYLGKKILKLRAAEGSPEVPFDHFIKMYGGYIPSTNARWCTKKLKLEPFERFVGNDPVVSYVGIRGDEDREGYISRKSNIQSIFPFRRNIWSEDVIAKALANSKRAELLAIYREFAGQDDRWPRLEEMLNTPVSVEFPVGQKLNRLLDISTAFFNQAVHRFLGSTNYPLGNESDFPLVDNEDVLVREDIFNLLRDSGVGIPGYYHEVPFDVNGSTATYARSRSGCFFCFYQQKIEWVWLYEQHPELFLKAMEYEKDGYTWIQDEPLSELIRPERIQRIKEAHLAKFSKVAEPNSPYLLDILADAEGEGCASCFI